MWNKVSLDAQHFLENGLYTNNGVKRDKEGLFQDEIVPLGSVTVWFYHGNPIALYDREKKTYTLSACGWNTSTTRARLNVLPDVWLSSRNYELCGKSAEKLVSFSVMKDMLADSVSKLVYISDAWRRWSQPPFSVVGASDTGEWSDSPCPSAVAAAEIAKVRAVLKSAGIKSYEAWGATSNCFCAKRYAIVRGDQYKAAREVVESLEIDNDYRLVHTTW